jgi:hypothetical protein
LQIGRSFGPLTQLIRAGFEKRQPVVVANAALIAEAILFGARDRGDGKFTRTLFDQQRRHDSLQEARPARIRSRPAPQPARSKRRKAGA